jgi:hypothetical protein
MSPVFTQYKTFIFSIHTCRSAAFRGNRKGESRYWLLLRRLNIEQSGEDFFRQARRRVPLILAVSTGSANEAWRKKDRRDFKV